MRGLVIPVLLGLTMDVTIGTSSIQLIPQHPVINGSVTLSVTPSITETPYSVAWYKGQNEDPDRRILMYILSEKLLFPGPLYNVRSFRMFANGSLQITDLQLRDGGNYLVAIWKLQSLYLENISVTLAFYESIIYEKDSSLGFTLGLIFAIILGIALMIMGSVYLYRKFGTQRLDESLENRQVPVYENVKDSQPTVESSYMDLQFICEETYTELNR
ncbi:uncharacterized protein [Engystomops pustulosus]|uniref:uncharacterized protein isoform X1 n=1 Tax=Engystomops pustulosus TaxID=76066 RepID=UPI003AFB32FF